MKQAITLREAAEKLAEQGYEIKWDENSTIEDFFSYFDHHYRRVLKGLVEGQSGNSTARKFLAIDILQIFR